MSQPAITRFVEHLIHRHHGDTRAALEEARELEAMSVYGRLWWGTVVAQLTYRYACERQPVAGRP